MPKTENVYQRAPYLQRMPDVPLQGLGGRVTPLIEALQNGFNRKAPEDEVLQRVKDLVEAGCQVDDQDRFADTALVVAVKQGKRVIVKYLLDQGADIEIRDGTGRTCLFHATLAEDGRMCRLLLERGAEVTVFDDSGSSPYDLANDKANDPICELLHKVRSTHWRPGKDPMLMNEHKEIEAEDEEETRANEDVMTVREDSQIGTILRAISSDAFSTYMKIFQKHKVSYLQFLQLNEEDMKEMGIEDEGVRQGLLRSIVETRRATGGSSIAISSDKITMPDVVCMVNNIDHHVKHMGVVAGYTLRLAKRNPQDLRFGREETSIQETIDMLEMLGTSNFSLGQEVVELTSLLTTIQRSPGRRLPNDSFQVDAKEMKKFVSEWDALKKEYTCGSSWLGSHPLLLGVGGLGIGTVAFTFGWKYLR